ncbi:hypothetical protein IEO21_04774 [Rhodonia placenta]|uniref:Alanine dehydrogenase/pyridine nucleotide transhydrogenase N-terminal domain-containing protein n=1 Tax=Rhodonia placenta TaxID=104341 RepID=A0A8H7P3A8_9APHY|nr:hypothetical protein IEO21_04774 [Postia placenta]
MPMLRRAPFRLIRASSTRPYHATPSCAAKLTIGIRREDPQRIWERRCPLTPDAVNRLVEQDDVDVLIQECDRRVWSTGEFVKAGAKIHPTLAPAHIIMGIKETPLSEVLNSPVPAPGDTAHTPLVPRTHLMFSHTIKGQLYNMELLSKYLSRSTYAPGGTSVNEPDLLSRLIDYELLTGEDGKRTVGFGWFAGVAGALESLNAMAHAHLELGVASPFLYTPRPHSHPTLDSIRRLLREEVGARIASQGSPEILGPIIFGVTGTGKVAEGVLDILQELPIEKVNVADLPALVNNPDTDLRKIYVLHALPEDYFARNDGQPYTRSDYYANPSDYKSEFHTKVAPYLSLLLHGAGWAPSFPRLMTNDQLPIVLEKARQIGKGRFACVGDISCDLEGGLEFLSRHSTLSAPFYSHRPSTLPAHLPPVTIMAVDILPTALPLEASQHFCNVLTPYLRTIISGYREGSSITEVEEVKRIEALDRATVARGGTLTENFHWLEKPLGIWSSTRDAVNPEQISPSASEGSSKVNKSSATLQPKKKVLLLGSGMVAGPAIEEICKRVDIQLIVASNNLVDAEEKTKAFANASALPVDMGDLHKVSCLVAEADVVISLLPAPLHPSVANLCIKHRKHLITTSYIAPAMKALHAAAVSADVLLLNEIGLDPGIDHCSAVSLLDRLRAEGNEILSFTSFCGGLPAPECAEDAPLGYKFSWSPRGVLSAALNDAHFLVQGREFNLPGSGLLQAHIPNVPVSKVLQFEGLANRDSLPYAALYGLQVPDQVRTVFRGTLRYPGFSKLMAGFIKIGLLETMPSVHLDDWSSLTRKALEERLGELVMDDEASILSAVRDATGLDDVAELIDALRWLSIMPRKLAEVSSNVLDRPSASLPPVPSRPMPPIDLFALLLAHKLRYQPTERDLVVLHHEIVAQPKPTGRTSSPQLTTTYTSSLISYGTPETSAMARCVGLPVAFAALQVLDGTVNLRGVHGPTDKAVYGTVLAKLEGVGLGMKESSRTGLGLVEETLHAHFGRRDTMGLGYF